MDVCLIGCHGSNLAGDVLVNEQPIGYLPAPNLTAGEGGIGQAYSDEEWERAIRHGVAQDGRTITFMAANYYANLSDDDVAAVIAYLKSVPAVDNDLGVRNLAVPGRIIFGVLAYDDLPVATIDHANVGAVRPAEGATAEYGQYLVSIAACGECHGADLTGRTAEDAASGPPAGPDLTSSGSLQRWTDQDFVTAVRTGQRPDGTQLSDEMPWRYYAGMTDDELQAIWLYLENR